MSSSKAVAKPPVRPPASFVQIERSALLPWEQLIAADAVAARLMMVLLGKMNRRNAIVISQTMLSKLLGVGVRTVQRSMRVLRESHWVQQVKVGNMTVLVINHAVAWTDSRELRGRYSSFDALVVADADEQDSETLAMSGPLNTVPFVVPPEVALVHEDPTVAGQRTLPGFHPVPEVADDFSRTRADGEPLTGHDDIDYPPDVAHPGNDDDPKE